MSARTLFLFFLAVHENFILVFALTSFTFQPAALSLRTGSDRSGGIKGHGRLLLNSVGEMAAGSEGMGQVRLRPDRRLGDDQRSRHVHPSTCGVGTGRRDTSEIGMCAPRAYVEARALWRARTRGGK